MRTAFFGGVALAALAMPVAAHAQDTTSQIRGTVSQGGSPIAGATLTITDTSSGTTATVTSNDDGSFLASGLRPGGPYTIEVASSAGNYTVTDIFTVVGQPYEVPIDLADTAGDIVVTASAIRGAGSVSDGPQSILTREEISRVATINRDVRDLMRRDPFARLEDTASGGRSVSFAGVNPRFNRFSVDGVTVSDNFGLNPDANPTRRGPVPIDAISQFSVSVAPYDIRQGNFQGGAVDSVLLSGTNEIRGTGFFSINTDGLTGERIGNNIDTNLDFTSKTYGATLSGPIIKDKLFLMVSAERNTEGNPISAGIAGEGAQGVPGLTRAQVSQIQQIAQSRYNYNAGDVLRISDDKDEKIVGKIDWNITDGQRLSLSYINAYDETAFNQNANTGNTSPSLGLESNGYQLTELLRTGVMQLNSDWSDAFKTEARFLYKSYERGQNALFGTGFAQFGVCLDPTSATIPSGAANPQPANLTACAPTNTAVTPNTPATPRLFFGPDISRQSNVFYTDTYAGSLLARVSVGSHELKLLAEMSESRIFNLFLQNTAGNYYFDSIADFQAGIANSVTFQRPASGDPNDAAANFKYQQYTFGIQDDWKITDRLNVSLGMRYDLYGSHSPVPLNPGFTSRYGFPNTKTFKGLGIFQPRIGFDWEPIDDIKIRGGYGIFGGGTPDVYLSNSYSNAGAGIGGVGINSVTVLRTGTNTYTVNGATLDPAVGAAILNNVNGASIPAALQGLIAGGGPNGLANINALDPGFDIPSVSKYTLSADWTPRDFFGGGWTFGADYYFSRTNDSVVFTDIRSIPVGTLPDGRTRFGALVTNNTNTDILLTNGSKGRSHIGVVRFNKQFDWGLNLDFAYSLQDVKDQQPATSSTAGSNYGNGAFLDGRQAAYGTANDQVAWSFKYGVGFDHAFFGDYRTVFQLFGETQAGRPYSITMEDAGSATRSAVFGVTGRDDRFLLYVPASTSDALVSYDSAGTQTALENLITNSKLKDFRGKIAPRNVVRSRAYTRLDLHLEQEIPTFVGKSRIAVFADIENLPNLLNKDWGGFRQAAFPYVEDVVRVQCLSTAVATGTAPTAAQINTAPTQPCVQYRYSSFASPNESSVEIRRSLYGIRVGARFSF